MTHEDVSSEVLEVRLRPEDAVQPLPPEGAVSALQSDSIEAGHARVIDPADFAADMIGLLRIPDMLRLLEPLPTEREVQVALLRLALERCDGHRTEAARLLGICAKTVYNRLATWREFQEDLPPANPIRRAAAAHAARKVTS